MDHPSPASDRAGRVDIPVALWCPACHAGTLAEEGDGLACHSCGQRYPVVRGVPVLINDRNSVFAIADYCGDQSYEGNAYGTGDDGTHGLRRLYRRVAHWLSEFSVPTTSVDADSTLADFCRGRAERPKVLVIGAGTARFGHPAEFVYTDVAFSPGVHAIADAHDLPFEDGSFDFVVAVAVLEHVADPQRVVSEIWRVLRPDGHVFAATPFLQPVHMGAYDFTRFTLLGHRRLFRHFSERSSGMVLGPGSVLASSVGMVLSNLSSARWFRSSMRFVSLLLSVPLKLLDLALRRNTASIDGAGGVFFYGTKSDVTISDREMIGLYRGGFR
jgi:hypothetical protein